MPSQDHAEDHAEAHATSHTLSSHHICMQDNTQRFTGRAEVYDRFRQRYPATPILDLLRAWCGLTEAWLIADIGAGTGMLAEVFLQHGNRVIAIEPNAEMRAACERLSTQHAALQVLDGTAEATTLADASVDMVCAGRAFHWFDKQRALAEFRRILKPGGWIVLVSLGRAHDTSAQTSEFERLLVDYGTDYNYVRDGYRIHDNMQKIFGPEAELRQEQIAGSQQLDWAAFRGQTMSLSVVPQPDHPNYAAFQRELRVYFETHADGDLLTMPTTCWITAARFSTR